jgi:hypothetical protein
VRARDEQVGQQQAAVEAAEEALEQGAAPVV